MPLSEQDLRRIHGGYLYIRDFDCLNGFGDDEWPHDYDRHLNEVERMLLARACEIVHNGGCHEVHTDTMPDLKTLDEVAEWLARPVTKPEAAEVHLEAKDGLYVAAP